MTIELSDKSELEITAELLQNVPDTYQKNAGYFIWDFMMSLGKVFVELWQKLQYLCGFFNIENLEYDDVVKFVYQRKGVIAHTETYAEGEITVTSGSGDITAGDKFETANGLEFKATETKTVAQGESFTARCTTAGAVGNVPVGVITVIPTTITGVVSVSNLTAFSGGYEKESKQNILERYFLAIREPIASGNIYHYKKWALEVTGVGNVKIKPLWNGDNTVKIIIVDSNNELASQTLLDAVQEYIDPYELINGVKVGWGCGNGQAPIGAYCTVANPTSVTINISAELTLKSGAVEADVKNAVENAISAYIKSTTFNDSYVSYARIGACILATDGVADYENLLVNNSTDNVVLSETTTTCEVAVLGTVTLTV